MKKEEFRTLCQNVVLLDGATGSNLIKAGMPRGVCTEEWVLDHEDVILDLQRSYVEAGTQILYAPTFGANREFLKGYGLVHQMEMFNKKLVEHCKSAAGNQAYVAGDMTGNGKVVGSSEDCSYAKVMQRYEEQMKYLLEAGVDLFVIETMLSLDETLAALESAQKICDLPVMCSLTIESDGTLYHGGNIYDAVETLQEMGADAVGINCSVGPAQLEAIVSGMKQRVQIPLIVKPNAGMPFITETGEAIYDMDPKQFAVYMKKLISLGANLVGGCCGTSPEYIKALKDVI